MFVNTRHKGDFFYVACARVSVCLVIHPQPNRRRHISLGRYIHRYQGRALYLLPTDFAITVRPGISNKKLSLLLSFYLHETSQMRPVSRTIIFFSLTPVKRQEKMLALRWIYYLPTQEIFFPAQCQHFFLSFYGSQRKKYYGSVKRAASNFRV